MIKLSDTQLVLLSAAAQRADGLLDIFGRLKGGAALAAGRKLLADGLVEEAETNLQAFYWRTDDADNVRYALRITSTGLRAIGIEADDASDVLDEDRCTHPAEPAQSKPSISKKDQVIALMSRERGATLAEITACTGWLAHTARAALSGLRKQGMPIATLRINGAETHYQVVPDAAHDGVAS